jgi:transposase-like protein
MKTTTCPRCQHSHTVKNGMALGKPRRKCLKCGYQFTRIEKRGKPQQTVHTAVILYLFGLSMNAIGRLLKVSTPAVLYWIKQTARNLAHKPKPTAEMVELTLALFAAFHINHTLENLYSLFT